MVERRGRRVVVDGAGPLADQIAALLRRCEVRVDAGRQAADAAELELRDLEELDIGSASRPDAVVLVRDRNVSAVLGAPWRARGVPHLPVTLHDGLLVIGPLVIPGVSGCLVCQELTQRDLMGAFPVEPRAAPPLRLDRTALDALGAAVATLHVLGVLKGSKRLAGVSTEVLVDAPTLTHRHWPPHPGCGCGAAERPTSVTMAG